MVNQTPSPSPSPSPELEGGNYELIRARLSEQARELGERAGVLNEARLQAFGRTTFAVAGQVRVRTENNCVPRDIVEVGGRLLFGYNVFLGLKTTTSVNDVLSLHTLTHEGDDYDVHDVELSGEDTFLRDPAFLREFSELYLFYKDARLLQLRNVSGKLLAVFQVSEKISDIKVFRWSTSPDGPPVYIDNRGERDHVFPPSHDFEWRRTRREDHVQGRFPHISILDKVFVETVGGDLTVKVENNTSSGEGIYTEPVEDAYQALDDAEIFFAEVGPLILIKVRPFREDDWRYLVFNTRTEQVDRIDAIGQACLSLPEDHGLIFPGGYYLRSGETKHFEGDVEGMEFKRLVRSPNGEDVLYVFHRRDEGRSTLLTYNMITKEVRPPIHCHGYSLFDDGRLVVFKADSDEPSRIHPMQIWQTPFFSDEHAASLPRDTSFLGRLGNAELVRGISDALSIRRRIVDQSPTINTYEDLIADTRRVIDNYHWMGHEQVGDLAGLLKTVLKTAELIVDEYEKVLAVRARAAQAIGEATTRQQSIMGDIRPDSWHEIHRFVASLDALRRQRGHIISLKEMRYADQDALEALEAQALEAFERLSQKTVAFLLGDEALTPYTDRIDAQLNLGMEAAKTPDLKPAAENLDDLGHDLDLLTEVISGLKIDDPTQRTEILERISEVFAQLNRGKATLAAHRKTLLSSEGTAEFAAEFKLFGQSTAAAIGQADTPDHCDDLLGRLMVQLEELEARFSEFDTFLVKLAEKRDEVYELFEGKKQQLLQERQRRAQNLARAADRILSSVARRARAFTELDELNTWFSSDPMVLKVKDITQSLRDIGDSVRADELEARVKGARQEAIRSLRDRSDLLEDGDSVIKLGRHRFSVNTQPLELTLIERDGSMSLHLTGTDYFEAVSDPRLEASRTFWQQALVSETAEVYRGEYLAGCMLLDAASPDHPLTLEALSQAALSEAGLVGAVRSYAAERYDEGYERGLHDADAALILEKLLAMWSTAGLLRYGTEARSRAMVFFEHEGDDSPRRRRWQRQAQSLGRLRKSLGDSGATAHLGDELGEAISAFCAESGLGGDEALCMEAGHYLAHELASPDPHFTVSQDGIQLRDALLTKLDAQSSRRALEDDLAALKADVGTAWHLAQAWLTALIEQGDRERLMPLAPALPEACALLIAGDQRLSPSAALTHTTVTGLLGQHPRISDGAMHLRLSSFLRRLSTFREQRVPGFVAWRKLRQTIAEEARARLRLDEFQPRVLSSFVRNRLINEVYLPLIGDNLAKQMGALGAGRRTDLMGILLLISPPGYGKTTLMEYVASSLGLVFMKVNGPALGHGVTSLDPAEAPSATARQEVEKIGLALEMGNNVMLYLDDIQHTHPELLQKFISLCDAQRRIEGVWRGRTRTYDLRGKKFCVVMAGNPYTESGERFQIPDMLSNRADTYNLGDILEGRDEAFNLSYVENSLTSNPTLAPLATREQSDIYQLMRMAQGEDIPTSQLAHDYSAAEIAEITSVFAKMFAVQAVMLKVNKAYIQSAGQDDRYRTEPPFKLQGSYRNMNKVAEKVASAMNDAELEALIDDHYTSEAQTLTTGAEQNLLKLAELRGKMTIKQQARWEEIKKTFARLTAMGEDGEDPITRVAGQLASLVTTVEQVAVTLGGQSSEQLGGITEQLGQVSQGLTGLRGMLEVSPARQIPEELQGLSDQLGRLHEAVAAGPDPALITQLHGLGEGIAVVSAALRRDEPQVEAPSEAVVNESLTAMAKHLDLIARILFSEWKRGRGVARRSSSSS